MACRDNQLKVMLPDDVYHKLNTMATRHKISMAEVIRQSIDYRYKMEVEAVPTCSNGRPCFVAHMFIVQQPTATPVPFVTPENTSRLVGPPAVVNS